MKTDLRKSSLSPACRRLVELMQATHFGRIESLEVRGGQPVFDPPPRVIRKIKIAAPDSPREGAGIRDFTLRKEVIEFFEHLDALGMGDVRCIEVKNGLPFSMDIEETARG